ncbi:MAG: hypothetical protein PUF60_00805 [Firmicutes bacterium]|nr:hypothetical protein [Bacillota bacterium]
MRNKGESLFEKRTDEATIRSSATEYLTYIASVGDQEDSVEMRYEGENIWLTQGVVDLQESIFDIMIISKKAGE